MKNISSVDIKQLRDLTGAGFLDCKEALENTNSDIDKAIDYLRKKGISTAEKKGMRTANDGLVAIDSNNKEASIVEINSETDFVARNEDFQNFVSEISKICLKLKGDMDKIIDSKFENKNENVSETLTNLIAKIGENISIKRCKYISVSNGLVGSYIHNVEKDNMGKIGVIISVKTNLELSIINDFLKKICMHIAASNPLSVNISSLDNNLLNKEKDFQLEEIKKSGKDKSIQDKILEGKMKKFYNEVILLEQNFIMDDSLKIKDFISSIAKELDGEIEIIEFFRFKVGESN